MKKTLLFYLVLSTHAYGTSDIQEKYRIIQALSITNPVAMTASNLADQVVMAECRKSMSSKNLKSLHSTDEFQSLMSAIARKKDILSVKETEKILTKKIIFQLCD